MTPDPAGAGDGFALGFVLGSGPGPVEPMALAYAARRRPRGLVRPVSQERMVAAVTPTAAASCSSLSALASRSLRRSLGEGNGTAGAGPVVRRVMSGLPEHCTG
ncbi:hypothetical protein GCM10010327_01160 [Streptomyces nitrosporeus]|nr:hypothetical protein GCM10010327_01160 [Streptomyces nitrosporeus]